MSIEKAKLVEVFKMIGSMVIGPKINRLRKERITENLEEKFDEMYPAEEQDAIKLRDFLFENQDKIDNRKYVLVNLYESIKLVENWNEVKKTANIKKQTLLDSIRVMAKMLEKEQNITICSLDNNDPFEIERINLKETLRKAEGKSPEKPKDERFDKMAKNGLLQEVVNGVYISDLRDCVTKPKELGDYIGLVSIRKALFKMGIATKDKIAETSVDKLYHLSRCLNDDREYRTYLRDALCEQILKHRESCDLDSLLMCAAYRSKDFIQKEVDNKQKTPMEVKELELIYNIIVDVYNELSENNIKFRARLVDQETGKGKNVKYTIREMKSDIKRLSQLIVPSNFVMTEGETGILKGLPELPIQKPLLERATKEEILGEQWKIGKQANNQWLAKQKAHFVSPEEKMDILTLDEEAEISKGIEGGAFEGYVMARYPSRKMVILECIWERDKDGNQVYPYGNSTVIVPEEMLDTVLKSKKKLENIPTMRELKISEKERKMQAQKGEMEGIKPKEYKQKRRAVRKNHGKNWKSNMIGIVTGKIDPFKITIRSNSRKQKKDERTDARTMQEQVIIE